MPPWLLHFLGLDSGSGPAYLFWSGFGANFGEFALAGGVLALYRRHNCQVKGCPRIGRHEFTDPDGVKRLLCWRHHPRVEHRQLSRERLHLYLGKQPGRG